MALQPNSVYLIPPGQNLTLAGNSLHLERRKQDRDDKYETKSQAQQRINDLELELQYTRENLQSIVEELESTNEELHSVNEEIHTVNAEYHYPIQQLTELGMVADIRSYSAKIKKCDRFSSSR